jgi:ParB family transcriptional regulator, chromosome partitioning protein
MPRLSHGSGHSGKAIRVGSIRYLGRVSKTLICEAVTEAKGNAAADNIATLKKGDMPERAAELLTGTAGFPLRCASAGAASMLRAA